MPRFDRVVKFHAAASSAFQRQKTGDSAYRYRSAAGREAPPASSRDTWASTTRVTSLRLSRPKIRSARRNAVPRRSRLPEAGALRLRHQVAVADPGNQRPVLPPHRYAVEARIGDRDRLDIDLVRRALGDRHSGGAEQRALERQKHVAVAGRALGEQHDRLACGQPPRDLARLLARLALAVALDIDRPLQPATACRSAASRRYRIWR